MADILPAQPGSARRNLLARHPLISFFVLAYALSWIVWSPWVLGRDGAGVLSTQIAPTAQGFLNAAAILAGPTVAALIVTAAVDGRSGLRALLRRLVLWRVPVWWYLFALLGIPAVMLLGFVVDSGIVPDLAALGGPSYLLSYLVTFIIVVFFGGPLFEEIGWRGFALPRMQRRQGPLLAAVTLGVLWAFWHLPQFLVPSWAAASGGGGPGGIVLFTIVAVTFSIITSWVFNNTRTSVLLAILVHASIDTATIPLGDVYPPQIAGSAVPLLIGFGGLAVVLVVATRGRLGDRRPPES